MNKPLFVRYVSRYVEDSVEARVNWAQKNKCKLAYLLLKTIKREFNHAFS